MKKFTITGLLTIVNVKSKVEIMPMLVLPREGSRNSPVPALMK